MDWRKQTTRQVVKFVETFLHTKGIENPTNDHVKEIKIEEVFSSWCSMKTLIDLKDLIIKLK